MFGCLLEALIYDSKQSSVLCAVLCVEENDCDVEKRALNCIDIDCFGVQQVLRYDYPHSKSVVALAARKCR